MNSTVFKPTRSIRFNFSDTQTLQDLESIDKDHTIMIVLGDKPKMNLSNDFFSDKGFRALQTHIHAPSEHTFNGQHFDLETHVVFYNDQDQSLAVVALFFDIDEAGDQNNTFVDAFVLGDY